MHHVSNAPTRWVGGALISCVIFALTHALHGTERSADGPRAPRAGTQTRYTGTLTHRLIDSTGEESTATKSVRAVCVELHAADDGRRRIGWSVWKTSASGDIDCQVHIWLVDPATARMEPWSAAAAAPRTWNPFDIMPPILFVPLERVKIEARATWDAACDLHMWDAWSLPHRFEAKPAPLESDARANAGRVEVTAELAGPYPVVLPPRTESEQAESAAGDFSLSLHAFRNRVVMDLESTIVAESERLVRAVYATRDSEVRTHLERQAVAHHDAETLARVDAELTLLCAWGQKLYLFPDEALQTLSEYRRAHPDSEYAPLVETLIETATAQRELNERAGPAEAPKSAALVGKPAPAFTLKNLAGREVSLSDLRGKLVLLVFWGVGCGPCREEAPHLNSLYKKYRDRGFEVLAVNGYDESAEQVQKFIDSKQYEYPVLLMGKSVSESMFHVTGYPTSFWIHRDGTVLSVHVGFVPGMEKDMEAELEKNL